MARRHTPTIVVAGTSSGVGKTTIAVGLMATLRSLGLRVQPFKVGPDFLDPMHHRLACGGVASVNLDGWMMGQAACVAAFEAACAASDADFAIVEGVMGLHDGLDGHSDVGSTAEMAKWLGAPVLLVVDAWCLSRSAAAMVHGYKTFDPAVNVAAVLFNQVSSEAHLSWLEQAIDSSASTRDVLIAGRLPKDERLHVAERLLGLVPPAAVRAAAAATAGRGGSGAGAPAAEAHAELASEPATRPLSSAADLAVLVELMRSLIDLDGLRALGANARPPPCPPASAPAAADAGALLPAQPPTASAPLPPVRIGVARDEAFCFYYETNLRALEAAGATLVPFSPLRDGAVPADVDALYLGGGYPELHAAALEANAPMRASVRAFCESGRFVLAECGGLMYLAGQLTASEPASEPAGESATRSYAMCGVLPFDTAMGPRMAMGYCTARLSLAAARLLRLPEGTALRSQQYHFSEATLDGEPAVQLDATGRGLGIPTVRQPAFGVRLEAPGAAEEPEGAIVRGGTLATYCHLHLDSHPRLAAAIVAAARRSLSVASLLPSGTELVAALLGDAQAGRRLVGVSEWCDFPPDAVAHLPAVTASVVRLRGKSSAQVEADMATLRAAGATEMFCVDVDWLRAARPGVCLTQETCDACDVPARGARAALARAGLEPERALTLSPRSVAEMLESVRALGAALGVDAEADALHARLSARLAVVAAAVAHVPQARRPRVLGVESVCPLVASGQWLPDLRERAGGRDALGGVVGAPVARLDWEDLRGADADVVVICCCGRAPADAAVEVVTHVLGQPGAWAMRALAASPPRVYVVDHAPLSRPGPRLVDGVEMLLALVHPALLPPALGRAAGGALRLRADAARVWRELSGAPAAELAAALFEPVLAPAADAAPAPAPAADAAPAPPPCRPEDERSAPAAALAPCRAKGPPPTPEPVVVTRTQPLPARVTTARAQPAAARAPQRERPASEAQSAETAQPRAPPAAPAVEAVATASAAGGAALAAPRRTVAAPVSLPEIRGSHAAELAQLEEALHEIEDLAGARTTATCALLHRVACERGCERYKDPATGYLVFTAGFLRKRPCCGRGCRHCPWGFQNVPPSRRTAALAGRVTPLDAESPPG